MPRSDQWAPVPAKPVAVPSPASSAPGTVPPVAETTPSVKPPEVASTPVNVGRYISEGQIRSHWMRRRMRGWFCPQIHRFTRESNCSPCRPTARKYLWRPTVKLTMAGEAFLKLHVPDAASSPRVTIDFGRLVLVPVGEMGNSLQVDFAGREGLLTFADVESVVAVEVRPYLPPGTNPLKATSSIIVQMWATTGGAEWREPEKTACSLERGTTYCRFMDEDPVSGGWRFGSPTGSTAAT